MNFVLWSAPKAFRAGETGNGESSANIIFEGTKSQSNKLVGTGEEISIKTDMVLSAIGQKFDQTLVPDLQVKEGKIEVTDNYETSTAGVFAGGDCIASGEDLTVQSIEDGKQAAIAIDRYLNQQKQIATGGLNG